MFTHSAVNFTWHQLSEHTLLHDLYPSKRKKGGPSPCDRHVLYSPVCPFMAPSVLPAVSRRLNSVCVPCDVEQKGGKKRPDLFFTWRVKIAKPPTGFVSCLKTVGVQKAGFSSFCTLSCIHVHVSSTSRHVFQTSTTALYLFWLNLVDWQTMTHCTRGTRIMRIED